MEKNNLTKFVINRDTLHTINVDKNNHCYQITNSFKHSIAIFLVIEKHVTEFSTVICENTNVQRFLIINDNVNFKETITLEKNSVLNDFVIDVDAYNNSLTKNVINKEGSLYNSSCFIKNIGTSIKKYYLTNEINMLSKAVVKMFGFFYDKSETNITVDMHITKTAKKSEALQEVKSLVFDKTAKIKALPILNIENNDVKAKHAFSTSKFNADQYGYLMSRGLDKHQIESLVCETLLINFLKSIENDKIKATIKEKIGFHNVSS